MTELIERFRRFFTAVNNAQPYPWQETLLERVATSGRWPAAITAPTGSGKSSVVEVHVFLVAERARARSLEAADGSEALARPPRRLVLVAPRRVLVEDQYERASRLAERLASASADDGEDPIVIELAEALRGLVTTEDEGVAPLGVARLRGGVRLDLSWRLDPAQCQIICATPQMWGSRLLMRGYRGSRRSRNLETGLLGSDVAVVIDEAHLHERLVESATRVAALGAGPLGLQVVAMSATRAGEGAQELTDRDLAHPSLRRRVRAAKRIEMVEVDDWRREAADALASCARRLTGSGTVGVFVNTVAMALDVAGKLDGEVEIVCGRMRPADVERLRRARPGLLDARGNEKVDYLVATQSLEVGIDLDLPALVTAIASPAALAQRAGRLNRSGSRECATFAIVVPRDLAMASAEELTRTFAPYPGEEIGAAGTWIEALDGDASPERISSVPLPDPPRVPLPALTRIELETLSSSGHALAADADVSFYVEEPRDRAERTIAIGARRFLDRPPEAVRQALLAAPPRAHELAGLSIGKHLAAVLAQADGSWLLRNDRGQRTAEPLSDPERLLPGDVVIVPHGSPICTRGVIGLTNARRGEPIADVMSEPPDGPPDVVLPLAVEDLAEVLEDDPTLGSRRARRALAHVVEAAGERQTAARLRGHRRLSDLAVTWCADPESDEGLLVVTSTEHEGRLPAAGAGDTGVTVDAHGEAVEDRLDRILTALDVDDVGLGAERDRLLAAARWHDEGKRHPRFQRRMGANPAGPEVAKPVPGHVADRGDGWRHEQLSAAVAWARSGRDPLVTTICAAHHGHGLPLFDRDVDGVLDGWVGCEEDVVGALRELFGGYGRYELERARLRERLGVHRLAYLEALLRCADMQVSREGR